MTTNYKYRRLDKNDVAVLLVDHQSGLCNIVGDFSPDEFKNNVLALADAAKYFGLPTILTTSFENGPNGPLVPELKALFPDAPYIARPGQINAWDNEDFVKAVKATGKKQLQIAVHGIGLLGIEVVRQDQHITLLTAIDLGLESDIERLSGQGDSIRERQHGRCTKPDDI